MNYTSRYANEDSHSFNPTLLSRPEISYSALAEVSPGQIQFTAPMLSWAPPAVPSLAPLAIWARLPLPYPDGPSSTYYVYLL